MGSPPKPWKSLSLFVPMHLTHLSNIANDNDFVNKSVRLSKEILISLILLKLMWVK
jgi:hypothetical protein